MTRDDDANMSREDYERAYGPHAARARFGGGDEPPPPKGGKRRNLTRERAAALEVRRLAQGVRTAADDLAQASGRLAHFLNPEGRTRDTMRGEVDECVNTLRVTVGRLATAVEQLQDAAAATRGEVAP